MLKLSELYVHTFNIESNRPRAAEVCAVVNQVARQVGKDRLTAYHGILAQEKTAFSNYCRPDVTHRLDFAKP